MQKDTNCLTKEWLKKTKMYILERSSHSPDLNPIEMMYVRAVYVRKPINIPEIRLFCTEERAEIAPSRRAGLT